MEPFLFVSCMVLILHLTARIPLDKLWLQKKTEIKMIIKALPSIARLVLSRIAGGPESTPAYNGKRKCNKSSMDHTIDSRTHTYRQFRVVSSSGIHACFRNISEQNPHKQRNTTSTMDLNPHSSCYEATVLPTASSLKSFVHYLKLRVKSETKLHQKKLHTSKNKNEWEEKSYVSIFSYLKSGRLPKRMNPTAVPFL